MLAASGGPQYLDGALAGHRDQDPDPEPITEFAPWGRIGTRVPHRWLDAGRTRSTIDLAGPGWAVLGRGHAALDSRVEAHEVDFLEVDFVEVGELALLRPDHVVAWRGTSTRADAAFDARAGWQTLHSTAV